MKLQNILTEVGGRKPEASCQKPENYGYWYALRFGDKLGLIRELIKRTPITLLASSPKMLRTTFMLKVVIKA